MKPVSQYFNEHPNKVGMNYRQHFWFAMNLAFHTFKASLASVVHAFLPFLFTTTTSQIIFKLYRVLKVRLPGDSDEPGFEIPPKAKKLA